MTVTSTLAPVAHPINPAAFLNKLASHGGGYCLTPDGQLYLGIVHTDASASDHGLALGLIANLTGPDLDAIRQHVAAKSVEPAIADTWSAAMDRFLIAERAYKACTSADTVDEARADDLCGIESDARWQLIGMPAPNRTALLWKLEYLFQGSNGSLDPYNVADLAQTLADMRRILGGDDSALTGAWQEVREVTRTLNGSEATLPNEDELQARLTRAERFIVDTPATTTAGILAKLQLAILHGCDDRADNDAMTAGDYDHLQRAASEGWDFDRKATFSALQSLRAMEA